ncbi:ATP-binding protein [Streptomyces sp. NPDC005407]|uniref:ATP-binding protein n=1 Tax=Streptomyces sp. NPDC005407 TaxID=3155340 RepID=UPI0033B447BD
MIAPPPDFPGDPLGRGLWLNADRLAGQACKARKAVRAALNAWGLGHMADDMELLASELTANAFEHARGPVDLVLQQRAARVLLEVRDRSRRLPAFRESDEWSEGGRGLTLVASFSEAWGCWPSENGKTIWCSLPISATAATPVVETPRVMEAAR